MIDSSHYINLFQILSQYLDEPVILEIFQQLFKKSQEGIRPISVKDLLTEIGSCSRCKDPQLPKWSKSPDLLIVLDYPKINNEPELVKFLVSTLSDVGFTSDNVSLYYYYLSYSEDNESSHLRSHLIHAISAFSPKVVLICGKSPFLDLFQLDKNSPFSDIKGSFYWFDHYCIIPTNSMLFLQARKSSKDYEDFRSIIQKVRKIISGNQR